MMAGVQSQTPQRVNRNIRDAGGSGNCSGGHNSLTPATVTSINSVATGNLGNTQQRNNNNNNNNNQSQSMDTDVPASKRQKALPFSASDCYVFFIPFLIFILFYCFFAICVFYFFGVFVLFVYQTKKKQWKCFCFVFCDCLFVGIR